VRVLVTGGAGFIGSHLVDRLLSEGYEVDAVDDLSHGTLANLAQARRSARGRFHFHRLDVTTEDVTTLIVKRKPDVIFHLAGQVDVRHSMVDPVDDAAINVCGSVRVIDAARQAGVGRVIYAASAGALYGDVDPNALPVSEEAPRHGESCYGISKAVVLDYLDLYRRTFGLPYVTLAFSNVYGPRQGVTGEGGVVAQFVCALLSSEVAVIYGDGRQTRDFVYVDDAVDALVRAIKAPDGIILNVGTGVEVSVNELYALVAKEVGTDVPARYEDQRQGEIIRSAVDAQRAGWYLKWHPFTPLSKGVADVVKAFRDQVG